MEKEIKKEIIYNGKILQLTKETVELENGNQAYREVVYHYGGVCILAVQNHKLLLVKQFRYPNRIDTLEIPAGKLEKNEEPQTCALRELEEETDYRATEMKFLMKFLPSPGYTSEWLYLYEAQDFKHVDDALACDDDENIDVIWMDIDEAYQNVLNGTIVDAKTAIAIMYLKSKCE